MKLPLGLHKHIYPECLAVLSIIAMALCFVDCADAAARGPAEKLIARPHAPNGLELSPEIRRRLIEEFRRSPGSDSPTLRVPNQLAPEKRGNLPLRLRRLPPREDNGMPADAEAVSEAMTRAAGKNYQVEIQKQGTSYNIFRVMPPPVGVRIFSAVEFDLMFKQIVGEVANSNRALGHDVTVRANGMLHSEVEAMIATAKSMGNRCSILAIDGPERATFMRSTGGEIVAIDLFGKSRGLIETFDRLGPDLDWNSVKVRRVFEDAPIKPGDHHVIWELEIPAGQGSAHPIRIYLVAIFQRLINLLGLNAIESTLEASVEENARSGADGWEGLAQLKMDLRRISFERPEAFGFWYHEEGNGGGNDLIIADAGSADLPRH